MSEPDIRFGSLRTTTAARILYQAIKGRIKVKTNESSLSRKRLYHRLHWFKVLVMITYLGITFFEKPSWCNDDSFNYTCQVHANGHLIHVPMSGLPLLPQRVLHSIELLCVFSIVGIVLLRRSFMNESKTAKMRTTAIMVLCCISTADNVQALVTQNRVYVASYLRPVIFVIFVREVRQCLMRIGLVLADARGVIALICMHVVFFSWLGVSLFSGMAEGQASFDSMEEAMWNMLVLLTTCNFPDIMLPAYSINRLYCIFFIVYLVIGLFILFNLLLAAFFNNYRSQIENAALNFIDHQRKACIQAFDLLEEGYDYISNETLKVLLEELRDMGMCIDYSQDDFILQRLDDHGLGLITRASFFEIIGVLREAEAFSKAHNNDSSRWCCTRNLTSASTWLLTIESVGIGIRLANFLSMLISEVLMFYNFKEFVYLQCAFFCYYWVEMGLKLRLTQHYFKSYCNCFDFLLNLVAILLIYSYLIEDLMTEFVNFDVFTFLRVLSVFTVFSEIGLYQVVFNTLRSVLPSSGNLFGVMISMFYLFSLVGVELFGGKVYAENTDINSDASLPPNYIYNNFNDFASGLVTLFELLIVNNWQVVAQTFTDVTSKTARIYFVLFYIMTVLVAFNLIVAFIIDSFNSQMEVEASRNADMEKQRSFSSEEEQPETQKFSKSMTSSQGYSPASSLSGSMARPLRNMKTHGEMLKVAVTKEQALQFMRATLSPVELTGIWRRNDDLAG